MTLDPYTRESLERVSRADSEHEPTPPPPTVDDLIDEIRAPDPGYCSVHGEALITHRQAGLRVYASGYRGRPVRVVCPSKDHEPGERERCGFCGGPLLALDGRLIRAASVQRAYCSDLHRNYAWRARQRRAAAR